MAKTNDDIYDILSELVTIFKQQNKNGGSNNLGANTGAQDDIFESLFNGFNELKRSAEVMSKKHHEYANSLNSKELKENIKNLIDGYTDANGEVIQGLKDLNSGFGRGAEKFNTTQKYYKEIAKTMDEQNSIVQDINVKKANLFGLEQKLYKEKLEQERLEIDSRKGTLESEIEVEKSKTKARKELLSEEIKTRKELNKQLASEKINLHDRRQKNANNIKEMAEERGKKWGLNKKGKETSFSEITKAFSKALSAPRLALQTQSVGRLAVKGVAAAANVGAGAAKLVQSGKMDVSGMADKASEALSHAGPYGAAAAGIIQILKVAFEMYSKVDKAASDYARSVGGGHVAQVKMRNSAAELAEEMTKFGKTAYLAEEILERMVEASENLGRNLEGLSTADLRSLKDLKNFGVGDDVIAQFDTFGISVHNVSKQIADLYGESGKRGLNAKATIKAFTSNLKMAQNYTFARGQKALMDMAMKSAQLKFNLRDAEQFANKVSTLEGAMTAGAQLSVLGGNLAMQGNPLAMMYNGLNDLEGLQNQMLAMTKGMARWNSKTGQLDMTAFDRERLRAMSQATGIDYSELTSQAFNQARVDRVSKQLGSGFSKDEEEYIKNLASLDEKGNAYIRVGDKEYSMNDIRDNKDGVRTQLKSESEAKDTKEGADLGDIWSSTRSIQDKLDDFIKFFQTRFTNYIIKLVAKVTKTDEYALKYGFDGEDKERYNKLKKVLDDKNISQEKINQLDEVSKQILRDNNIINSKGQLIRSELEKNRYSVKKTLSWGQSAEMYGKYKTTQSNEVQKASGGFVSGDGGPTEDAIPARLSNGEFVVNAEATTRHRPLLERINSGIRNGSNLMRAESIMGLSSGELRRGGGNQKIDVSPIKIEFGTLELKIGDLSRVLDSNEVASRLLNNSAFVDNIVKEIGIRANFGYRKDDSSNKFLDSPFVRSF
jgi:hypothetical protein